MKPTIICLTPVKNEAWCLDDFLKSASLWADYIIICDQFSTDGSREIASQYPKVRLIDNPSLTFNEPERQKMLIDEARKIAVEGKRLLITLDADEMFSPDFLDKNNNEWQNMLNAQEGTIFRFQLANLHPDGQHYWEANYFPWGFMDDGSPHNENAKIHTARIPLPANASIVDIQSIKVIHRQFIDWKRMESKHRWYQAYERITYPQKNAVDIFRMYHHMYQAIHSTMLQIPQEWFDLYDAYDVSFTRYQKQPYYWFDIEFAKLIDTYGYKRFSHLYVWGKDVAKAWEAMGRDDYYDPRSMVIRLIHAWLFKTQLFWNKHSVKGAFVRKIDKLLRKIL